MPGLGRKCHNIMDKSYLEASACPQSFLQQSSKLNPDRGEGKVADIDALILADLVTIPMQAPDWLKRGIVKYTESGKVTITFRVMTCLNIKDIFE